MAEISEKACPGIYLDFYCLVKMSDFVTVRKMCSISSIEICQSMLKIQLLLNIQNVSNGLVFSAHEVEYEENCVVERCIMSNFIENS